MLNNFSSSFKCYEPDVAIGYTFLYEGLKFSLELDSVLHRFRLAKCKLVN